MAFTSTTAWDVRTTGSDSNGGGFDPASTGTDYSQQDAAQVAYTDLVIGATNTQLTSAAHPFTSAHVGNVINITGGTGFTVQRVQITSVAGSTATCDKACGTASSTGGTGNLGGGLLTIATATGLAVASNTINIKQGTYTFTAALAVPVTGLNYVGYGTTHGDNGTRPLITTATSSVDLFSVAGISGTAQWTNINFSNTAATRGNGIVSLANSNVWIVLNCKFTGFLVALNADNVGAHYGINLMVLAGVEITACTNTGARGVSIACYNGSLAMNGCWLHDNTGVSAGGDIYFAAVLPGCVGAMHRCIFSNLPGGLTAQNTPSSITNCVFYAVGGSTYTTLNIASDNCLVENNIFYSNYKAITATQSQWRYGYANAFGSNTVANTGWPGSTGDVALTANPFVNSAGNNFALNSTAGGGAALKAAGFPATIGATTANSLDIGAAQSGAGGGGGGAWTWTN